jgi:ribosomal protein L37AE/L43A
MEERREIESVRRSAHHECEACRLGIHDVHYTDEGVAICLCCARAMPEDAYPRLEFT